MTMGPEPMSRILRRSVRLGMGQVGRPSGPGPGLGTGRGRFPPGKRPDLVRGRARRKPPSPARAHRDRRGTNLLISSYQALPAFQEAQKPEAPARGMRKPDVPARHSLAKERTREVRQPAGKSKPEPPRCPSLGGPGADVT